MIFLFRLTFGGADLGNGEWRKFAGKKVGDLYGSAYDQALREANEGTISFFHKGNLNGGVVSGTRELSTGLERSSVDGIRNGKLWEFRVPKGVYNDWKSQNLANKYTDYDYATGIYNQEIRFSPKLADELNKYIIKRR